MTNLLMGFFYALLDDLVANNTTRYQRMVNFNLLGHLRSDDTSSTERLNEVIIRYIYQRRLAVKAGIKVAEAL